MNRFSVTVLAAIVLAAGCSRKEEPAVPDDGYVFEGVKAATAYAVLAEKPDAVDVLLIGKEAKALKHYFANAGTRPTETIDGKADIVLVDCARMSEKARERLEGLVSDSGVVAWMMNVKGVSAREFGDNLRSFRFPRAHLWMPGENRWLLVARKTPKSVKLDSVLEVFSRDRGLADLGGCGDISPASVFAGYVGTAEEIMPAFAAGELSAKVRPEFFIPRETNPIGWLSPADMDGDMATNALAQTDNARAVRKLVVEAAMKAAAGDEKGAVEMWASAEESRPGDIFLRERLDRLERNARGFLAVKKVLMAMKCYETMLLIRPDDTAAMHNFGMCLKSIGKLDLAEKILARARELSGEKEMSAADATVPARRKE